MSVPTLPVSDRFFTPEINVIKWLPTVEAPTAGPSRPEIDGGVALQDEIAAISGWSKTPQYIETPDAGHRLIGRIPGRVTLSDSSLTFYASRDGQDIRQVLAEGDKGFVWFADGGDVAGHLADLFEVEVASIGKARSVDANAFQLTISFALKRSPVTDIEIPATA